MLGYFQPPLMIFFVNVSLLKDSWDRSWEGRYTQLLQHVEPLPKVYIRTKHLSQGVWTFSDIVTTLIQLLLVGC